jgi:hypothetical protein
LKVLDEVGQSKLFMQIETGHAREPKASQSLDLDPHHAHSS